MHGAVKDADFRGSPFLKTERYLTSTSGQLSIPQFPTKTRDPIISLQFVAFVTGEVKSAALVVLLAIH